MQNQEEAGTQEQSRKNRLESERGRRDSDSSSCFADAAYDAPEIKMVSEMLGHVPIIDPNKRRGEEKELEPASQIRYHVRTGVERANSEMKDNYGANHVRVKGHLKVLCHLMFGVLVLTVKRIFNYFA